MKPIDFKERNIIFAKDQSEYQSLPAYKNKNEGNSGEVVSCWSLSFRERIKVLFSGKLYVSLMTFNKTLNPTYITVNKEEVI